MILLPASFAASSAFLLLAQIAAAQKFDPYQLNGGLVTAVAGRDYVLIASDTRLTDGGYGINSRRYLSGRIWSASSSSSSSSPSLSSTISSAVDSAHDADVGAGGGSSSPSASSSSTATLTLRRSPAQWESDGALVMPSGNRLDYYTDTNLRISPEESDCALIGGSPTSFSTHMMDSRTRTNLPIMVGSAGCASDCEALKRRMRLELDALECSSPAGGSLGVQSVANLLQQILYGRRGFPFYSFCVVAGMDREESHGGGCGSSGAVYVYDAIGSYERVAVACAGTGRELLQPVLDHLFSGTSSQSNTDEQRLMEEGSELCGVRRDSMAVSAGNQRRGVAGSLRPPVQTIVDCSWEEAVRKVARAYQSVAEREISVGDEIVICVVNASSKTIDGGPLVDVFRYPLKKH